MPHYFTMSHAIVWTLFFLFTCLTGTCRGDIPVNCTIEDILGEWIIYEGPTSTDPNLSCSDTPIVHKKIKVTLAETYALENKWAHGTWTMVYNQGMDIFLSFRNYFAYFMYETKGQEVKSICNATFVGKSHDVTLRNFACFYAKKVDTVKVKIHQNPFIGHPLLKGQRPSREAHESIVEEVNKKQTLWKAAVHEPFVNLTYSHLIRQAGGTGSWLPYRPPAIPSKNLSNNDFLDWRNFAGENFVSPVRNQGQCGSCYAFSSAGMIETRLRVFTKNRLQPLISPQDIVSCTPLAQGCEGGFPYLIAGKYGWETGLVQEDCVPYEGRDDKCPREKCPRWYTAAFGYVGGRYGACSEEAMIASLRNGPISVSFNVYPDFMHYKSGIYHYTGVTGSEPGFRQFIPVNHAVLLVGFGVDQASGTKYWTVKNSWGEEWGENGYFRILRGVDEVGIESIAVQAFPIPI